MYCIMAKTIRDGIFCRFALPSSSSHSEQIMTALRWCECGRAFPQNPFGGIAYGRWAEAVPLYWIFNEDILSTSIHVYFWWSVLTNVYYLWCSFTGISAAAATIAPEGVNRHIRRRRNVHRAASAVCVCREPSHPTWRAKQRLWWIVCCWRYGDFSRAPMPAATAMRITAP